MKARFHIFIDRESLFSLAECHSNNFERIFRNRATVYLDMSESEIDEMDNISDGTANDPIRLFLNEIDITPYSGKSQFELFYSEKGKLSDDFNGCIFFLNIPREEAKLLSQESGVWILSKEEIDSEAECIVLEEPIQMDREDVIPNHKFVSDKNGWKALFGDRLNHFPPFNEIIIYDNFIKEYDKKYSRTPYDKKYVNGEKLPYTYIGLENLLILFNAILPEKHTLMKIIISLPKYTEKDKESKLEKRIKIWIDEVKRLRSYNISVTCLLIGNKIWNNDDEKERHPVHPRVLYTNFFSIETDKGFKIFEPHPNSNIVRVDGDSNNSISVHSYFANPKMKSNPITANYNNKIKDIGHELQIVSKKMESQSNNIIGDYTTIESFSLFDEIDFETL